MSKTKFLFKILLALVPIAAIAAFGYYFYFGNNETQDNYVINKTTRQNGKFDVYQDKNFIGSFQSQNNAVEFASKYARTEVKQRTNSKIVWDNFPPYQVFIGDELPKEFSSLNDSISYARSMGNAYIYHKKSGALVWNSLEEPSKSTIISKVPHIMQYPELPRGCEVTSLAMLLRFLGKDINKMTLADEIKKDTTSFTYQNGKIHFGNPNNGFVGDMKSRSKPGYGVYHEPVFELLRNYLDNNAIDLTGTSFENLIYFLYKGRPVWIITNYTFKPLPKNKFITWNTPSGEVKVTYDEHSVLITGYDDEYIFFNDPLSKNPGSKASKAEFIKAWEQMGSQAISFVR